jgi:hypothetical protein
LRIGGFLYRQRLKKDWGNIMNIALELADSHVSFINLWEANVTIFFSHAYIHKSSGRTGRDDGKIFSQEAELVLYDVTVFESLPLLPNTVSEGFLEVGGIRHERLPLPFHRKVSAILSLEFVDGSVVVIAGLKPQLELFGQPTFVAECDQ